MSTDLFDWTDRSVWPLRVPWPSPGRPNDIREFDDVGTWHALLQECDLEVGVSRTVRARFELAQKLYALAWYDAGTIKAAELVAVTALEMAMRERYAERIAEEKFQIALASDPTKKRKNGPPAMFNELLHYMVDRDGLTDTSVLPSAVKYHPPSKEGKPSTVPLFESEESQLQRSGTLVERPITLAGIRNSMAHGDPLLGFPWAGLLEFVRDLIQYAFRDCIADAKKNPDSFVQPHTSGFEPESAQPFA